MSPLIESIWAKDPPDIESMAVLVAEVKSFSYLVFICH
jgi:hypothetical protein